MSSTDKATSIMSETADTHHSWTFFSNYAHVLVCLSKDPSARLKDVAAHVRITERATQRIVGQLEAAGVLKKLREGRRNHYQIDPKFPLRHPLESHKTVGSLLKMVQEQ